MSADESSKGRPRDRSAGPALMAAARELVLARGYEDVSIRAIVERAGVGRQTLYRRWPGKADLVLDAFLESVDWVRAPDADLGVGAALERYFRDLFVNLREDAPAIRSLIASAQGDAEFLVRFRERFVEPRAVLVAAILERGVEAGELRGDIDVGATVAVLDHLLPELAADEHRQIMGETARQFLRL